MSKTKKIIRLWAENDYPEDVRKDFEEWFAADNKSAEKDEAMAELWNFTRASSGKQIREAYSKAIRRIRPQRAGARYRTIAAAAILAIPLLLVGISLLRMDRGVSDPVAVGMIECYAPNGGMRTIVLPDSSVATLNSGTLVVYPEKFTAATREIFVSGEAIFDVKSDPGKPFVVNTSDMRIEALGTVFNVSSYADENTATTTLNEGSVRITMNEGGHVFTIVPDQQVVFDRTTGNALVRDTDADRASGWKDGGLLLEGYDIHQIIRTIGRRYGVNVYLSSGRFDNARITAKFIHGETLDELMSILRELIPGLRYRIEERNVYVF